MSDNALSKIFDMVAATRTPHLFSLYSTFSPLQDTQVNRLQELVKTAIEQDTGTNKSVRESLLRVAGKIDRYNAMPRTISYQAPEPGHYDAYGRADPLDAPLITMHASNPERPQLLKKLQRNLYKLTKNI